MTEHTDKRDAVAAWVAERIRSGLKGFEAVAVVDNMVTFTSDGITYNAIVTIARRQQ